MPKTSTSGYSVHNVKARFRALKKYYADPNICENCQTVIEIGPNDKISDKTDLNYCSESCANEDKPRRQKQETELHICAECGDEFDPGRTQSGRKSKAKYCSPDCRGEIDIGSLTLNELYDNYERLQARSKIAQHARRIFSNSVKEEKCKECGYDLHIDVCHIQAVSEFGGSTRIEVVNDIDNLVGFCKNHHWEFDHGYLDL